MVTRSPRHSAHRDRPQIDFAAETIEPASGERRPAMGHGGLAAWPSGQTVTHERHSPYAAGG
jgi:hypothetical protein